MKRLLAVGLALVLALGLTVPAMAQGSVEPSEVNIETYPGGAVIEVDKEVTTSELPLVIDIVLLEDETGSFDDDIANLQGGTTASDIYDTVLAVTPTPDVQFGVAGFRDYPREPWGWPGDHVYRELSGLSPDKSAWLTGIAGLTAGGGNDYPEAQYDAIVAAAGGMDWRDNAQKVLIVATDAPFHLPGADKPHVNTQAMTLTALGDIIVVGLKAPGAGDELDALAAATGGSVQLLSPDGANIAAAILAGLEALTTDVWGIVGETPAGITVTLDPPVQYDVPGATTVCFDEYIGVVPITEPGEYSITVTFYANSHPDTEGAEIGTQTITIEVLPLVEVDKHWSYTDVCFMQDNDGDGLYDEDPVNFDVGGNPIDDDEDGLYNEDPVDCDGEYSMGTELIQLEATVKKGTIKNINPGQFYAVSTVTVLEDLDELVITEDYSDVISSGIGELNPVKGGGKVIVVQMIDGMPAQILDAMDEAIEVDLDKCATITLENVVAGDVYKVYVKFEPTLKGSAMSEYAATNHNCAHAVASEVDGEQYTCADAMIKVIEKVGDED